MVECQEHFRFVGVEAAGIMHEKKLTLEEYHDPSIVRPDPYDPGYIFMSVFGPKMKGHWQNWPDIDLEELKAVNPDVVGWVYMENTPINYPVLFHKEFPGYYINHNFSDEPSAHGGIEMLRTPEDGIFILSAHHMKDCSMFMKLVEIDNYKSFDVHPVISFNYEGTIYDAFWFAALIIEYGDSIPLPEAEDAGTRKEWYKKLKEKSFASNEILPDETDKILICSTCSVGLVAKQVLYGVMKERENIQ
jgi:sortase B